MRILTVVGARPQFVKAAPLGRELRRGGHREVLVHTGQHYDREMSQVFFDELGMPAPDHHLGVGSGPHGRQTGAMLEAAERVILAEKPDLVVVFGDTNSTLAGALAAAKLRVPVAHIEAGLRSFKRDMPEEVNRVATDHLSTWLFCPSDASQRQLAKEGLESGVHVVGDIMLDALRLYEPAARKRSALLERLGLAPRGYYLATVHRAENTDDGPRLAALLAVLDELPLPVVLPLHPRTRDRMHQLERAPRPGLIPIEPVGYLDMLRLEACAAAVVTDSGGVQKEAYSLGVPCLTLREETEWVETVAAGWNFVCGADGARVQAALARLPEPGRQRPQLYGDGHAAERIVAALEGGVASRPLAISAGVLD